MRCCSLPTCRSARSFCSWTILALLAAPAWGQAPAEAPVAAAVVKAAGPDHAIVPGFERFYAEAGDKTVGGQLLLTELNCTSCHAVDKSWETTLGGRKQAPILDKVGNRVQPSYLRTFLANPHGTKPGTTMPDLFAGETEAERKEKIEALVHYLAFTGNAAQQFSDPKNAAAGSKLFHQIGCVACHGPQGATDAVTLATSMPLGDLTKKYTIPGLIEFLGDPLKIRPAGRMPGFAFKDNELRDVAHFLMQGVEVKLNPNSKYAYYEADFGDKLPDLDKLQPKAQGESAGFDIAMGRRENNFGLKFTSNILTKDGDYTFFLTSDDGAKLWIDGKLVVDNDGTHPPQEKSGKTKLTAGPHEIVVGYFNGGGGGELYVDFEGGGVKRQRIDPFLTLNKDGSPMKHDAKPGNDVFALDPDLAAKGKEIFATIGCASCHTMNDNKKAIESKFSTPTMAQLKLTNSGCLSAKPSKGTPHYQLSAAQQAALAAVVPVVAKPAAQVTAVQKDVVAHTLTRFNCFACHQRDKQGGVETARDPYFTGTQKEMGDEGRLPPSLDGVGAKLTPEWMKQIFNNGTKDRNYMHARMPKFGSGNVGQLVDAFGSLDPIESVTFPTFSEPVRRVKADARMLIGDKAFGCIKCHNFNNIPATGIQAMDMATMTKRLKHDWFHRYLVNPQAFRPGTRMPSAWPNGKTQLPGVLDGDTAKQIEAMWVFLDDGGKAAVPEGLAREPIVLTPVKEAIIYRNFIEGAGPRAIGVGYPEKANLAYDANNLRLALIWQGAFIDASKHWLGRGPGFQAPLGDGVVRLPDGASFATLASPNDPWPSTPAKELGQKFRGYRVSDDQRPTFLTSIGEVEVEDFPNAVVGTLAGKPHASIKRTFSLSGSGQNLYFRAAVAGKIEAAADGAYTIDGDWTLKVQSAAKPQIRTVAGKTELLIPVTFEGNKAKFAVEYVW